MNTVAALVACQWAFMFFLFVHERVTRPKVD